MFYIHACMCTDLIEDSKLNSEAAKLSNLPEGEEFTMANFTYANSAVVSRMLEHLKNTDFLGISVSVYILVYLIQLN